MIPIAPPRTPPEKLHRNLSLSRPPLSGSFFLAPHLNIKIRKWMMTGLYSSTPSPNCIRRRFCTLNLTIVIVISSRRAPPFAASTGESRMYAYDMGKPLNSIHPLGYRTPIPDNTYMLSRVVSCPLVFSSNFLAYGVKVSFLSMQYAPKIKPRWKWIDSINFHSSSSHTDARLSGAAREGYF